MTLNVRTENNTAFSNIGNGECFRYHGEYYIAAYDDDRDEYFGVNLATGEVKFFDSEATMRRLTGTVSFKELE